MATETNRRTARPKGARRVRAGVADGRSALREWGAFSPLTRRILAVNVLALAILVGGVLYLEEYRDSLIHTELQALRTEAQIIAGALGESAVDTDPIEGQWLVPEKVRQIVRRLSEPARTRARLFAISGDLLADSRTLSGSAGKVQVEELPSPRADDVLVTLIFDTYRWVIGWLPRGDDLPPYRETGVQRAADYMEVLAAFTGESGSAVRMTEDGQMVLSVAVPVQRYRRVVGALMLTTSGAKLEQSLRAVRLDILKVFAVVLAITVLLSFYLAGTIARPIRRLATAAERVRSGRGRRHAIPDFTGRRDEIGELGRALRDMTDALWERMDAIERFAADVAHEIKNPLTSLRSAIETAARVQDPEQQRRLLTIVLEDVQRLDRLISDISDASRLDAELSRAESVPVDLGGMLATLADIHRATAAPDAPRLVLEVADHQDLTVPGIEDRLAQVLQNLIANALSFSPPKGVITLKAARENGFVQVVVEDQGPGLPENKLEAIFERFYSDRPAGEKFGTHSGLGLSISKQIAEAHGGTITAENRRDKEGRVKGARFIIRLPER